MKSKATRSAEKIMDEIHDIHAAAWASAAPPASRQDAFERIMADAMRKLSRELLLRGVTTAILEGAYLIWWLRLACINGLFYAKVRKTTWPIAIVQTRGFAPLASRCVPITLARDYIRTSVCEHRSGTRFSRLFPRHRTCIRSFPIPGFLERHALLRAEVLLLPRETHPRNPDGKRKAKWGDKNQHKRRTSALFWVERCRFAYLCVSQPINHGFAKGGFERSLDRIGPLTGPISLIMIRLSKQIEDAGPTPEMQRLGKKLEQLRDLHGGSVVTAPNTRQEEEAQTETAHALIQKTLIASADVGIPPSVLESMLLYFWFRCTANRYNLTEAFFQKMERNWGTVMEHVNRYMDEQATADRQGG